MDLMVKMLLRSSSHGVMHRDIDTSKVQEEVDVVVALSAPELLVGAVLPTTRGGVRYDGAMRAQPPTDDMSTRIAQRRALDTATSRPSGGHGGSSIPSWTSVGLDPAPAAISPIVRPTTTAAEEPGGVDAEGVSSAGAVDLAAHFDTFSASRMWVKAGSTQRSSAALERPRHLSNVRFCDRGVGARPGVRRRAQEIEQSLAEHATPAARAAAGDAFDDDAIDEGGRRRPPALLPARDKERDRKMLMRPMSVRSCGGGASRERRKISGRAPLSQASVVGARAAGYFQPRFRGPWRESVHSAWTAGSQRDTLLAAGAAASRGNVSQRRLLSVRPEGAKVRVQATCGRAPPPPPSPHTHSARRAGAPPASAVRPRAQDAREETLALTTSCTPYTNI